MILKIKNVVALTIATLCFVNATAYDFKVGDLCYKINSDNTSVAVTNYDENSSANYPNLSGAVTIPTEVSYNGRSYSVTKIDERAFAGCSELTSVTIGNSVTSIGDSAFYECSGLTSIEIPNSVISIEDCAFEYTPWYDNQPNGLVYAGFVAYKYKGDMPNGTSITIKNGTLGIADRCFNGLRGLTDIDIPNSVISIGLLALYETSWYDNQPNGLVYAGLVAYEYKGDMPNGTSITIKNGTLGIADWCFDSCSGLTSVSIPNSVTMIGDRAFARCSELQYIIVESGNTNYDSRNDCNAIIKTSNNELVSGCKNTVIPSSVTSIGDSAFSGHKGLTSIDIPSSVTSIDSEAFSNCSGLTSVDIPGSVTKIGDGAFWGCSGLTSIEIPNSITYINDGTFDGCSGLTSVTIPNSVTEIGGWAFSACSGLTSITIPNSVTSIGYSTFYGCSGLTSVTIPNSVTSIGDYAFYDCSGLTSVTIGSSVTEIGENAFKECRGITIVNWNAKDYPDITKVYYSPFYNLTGINTFNFGNEVRKIPAYLCYELSGLTSVTIPNSVTSIGGSAFQDCAGLTSVTIPNSVTSIGTFAFYGCTGLTSVTIGNSVTEICDWAFGGCTRLKSVTNLAETPQAIDDVFGFIDLPTCKLFVPKDVVDAYATAEIWEDFGEIIGLEDEPITYSALDEDAATVSHVNPNVDGTVEIPETTEIDGQEYSVAAIADNAFENCEEITSVIIPNSVVSIGANAFSGCSGLKSVTLPNWTEEEVPTHLLSIREITPKQIGAYAFANCTGLEDVYNDNAAPQFVTADVFDGIDVSKVCLHVPEASIPLYQAAEVWKDFHIEALDGVDEISTDKGNAEIVDIYNLQGVRLKVPVSGQTVIVRYTDGTAKKIIVR